MKIKGIKYCQEKKVKIVEKLKEDNKIMLLEGGLQ
jgi:hypothetical protein